MKKQFLIAALLAASVFSAQASSEVALKVFNLAAIGFMSYIVGRTDGLIDGMAHATSTVTSDVFSRMQLESQLRDAFREGLDAGIELGEQVGSQTVKDNLTRFLVWTGLIAGTTYYVAGKVDAAIARNPEAVTFAKEYVAQNVADVQEQYADLKARSPFARMAKIQMPAAMIN